MTAAELQKFFEDNKADKVVVDYLAELRKTAVTPETVEAYLVTEDGKKLLQPRLDSYFTKGLETFKTKTMPSLIEEEIKKKFPAETEDQKRFRKMEDDLAAEKNARLRETLKNRAITALTQKGLPLDLVDYTIGTDEATTDAALAKIAQVWDSQIQVVVEKRIKDGGRTPENTGKLPPDIDALIAKAESDKDFPRSIALKNQKAAAQMAASK